MRTEHRVSCLSPFETLGWLVAQNADTQNDGIIVTAWLAPVTFLPSNGSYPEEQRC